MNISWESAVFLKSANGRWHRWGCIKGCGYLDLIETKSNSNRLFLSGKKFLIKECDANSNHGWQGDHLNFDLRINSLYVHILRRKPYEYEKQIPIHTI